MRIQQTNSRLDPELGKSIFSFSRYSGMATQKTGIFDSEGRDQCNNQRHHVPHVETTKLEQNRAKIDESEDCGSNHHNENPNSYTRTDELETARWRQEVDG
ncbi:hypothetical protein RND81_06G217200 [Saponaria officinalis]|uniref:Uncharacterized protein n=1 Tax=Saponaria officinalis TaxID=3572 RepID=A0AAW1KE74_SAPOF